MGNSFVIKKDGVTFSKEKNNLTNQHTFTSSGLIHKSSVGVNVNKGSVVISARKGKAAAGKIRSANYSVTTGRVNNFPRVARNVKAASAGSNSRMALARWTKIDRALKTKKSITKKRQESKKKPSSSADDLA